MPWRPLAAVFVAGLGINLLLAVPLYSVQVFDRVLASRSVETLALLSAGVLIALGAMAPIGALGARLLLRLGNRYSVELEPRLVSAGVARLLSAADRMPGRCAISPRCAGS